MKSLSIARALPLVSLFSLLSLPLATGCFENDPVGTDDVDAGNSGSGTGSGTGSGSASKSGSQGGDCVDACNEPVVPEGCSLTEGACVNGVYHCPEVVCPDGGVGVDAGSGPAPTCSVANPTCPAGLECVYAFGDCSGNGECLAPANSGCNALESLCGCNGAATVVSGCGYPTGYASGPTTGVSGVNCDTAVDAGPGGPDFACGKAFCNPSTEYCRVTEGGVAEPDAGSIDNTTCQPLVASCVKDEAGSAAECACLAQQVGGQCTVANGSDFTVTIEVP
jgi:hypothetical protein